MSTLGKRWRIILTVGGALIAAILGAAAQEVLDTNMRMAAAAVVLVGLTAIASFAALVALVESRKNADVDLLATLRGVAVVQERSMQRLAGEVATLSRHIGLRVDTMMLSELNTGKSLDHDRTVQLMLTATRELKILDILMEDGRWPDEVMDRAYQDNAFDAFFAVLRRPGGVSYKRIIQVADPAQSLCHAQTPNLIRHCHTILELQSRQGAKASLRVTRQRFPFKFILIDDSAVVLQLQEYGDSSADLRIWGEVLITDPGNQLIEVFRNIWDEIMDDPSTRTVKVGDLPPKHLVAEEPSGSLNGSRPPAPGHDHDRHARAENGEVRHERHVSERPDRERGQGDQGTDREAPVRQP
ncbi:hypothetical protein [Actinoplanes sp. GCM10030250]|uniref:hypothetical protein n=1 Tax=Actinoplanes sp. GCM10030250 TaxID=3273376 RepID=UPI00362380E9